MVDVRENGDLKRYDNRVVFSQFSSSSIRLPITQVAIAAPGGIVMSQINPITYFAIQGLEAQRSEAADKQRRLRRALVQEKEMANHEDVVEHQVESSEEVQPIHDEAGKEQRRPKPQLAHHKEEEDGKPPHIDLTA